MPKFVQFGEFLKTQLLRLNSDTRQVNFNSTKIDAKCQIPKSTMRHFGMISKHCALAFFPFFENSKLSQVFSGKKNLCLKGPYMNIHWRTEGMFVCNIDPRSNNSSTKSIQKAQRQQWSVDLKQWAPGGSRERCINGILYKTKFLKCTHKYHSPVSKTGLLPNRKCSEFSLRKSTEKKKIPVKFSV